MDRGAERATGHKKLDTTEGTHTHTHTPHLYLPFLPFALELPPRPILEAAINTPLQSSFVFVFFFQKILHSQSLLPYIFLAAQHNIN